MARRLGRAKWGEAPARTGRRAMLLGVSLSEGLGCTVWTLKARDRCDAAGAMPFTRRQEELWRTTVLRHFPTPLPKVRKLHDAGTAVGPRTDIQEPPPMRKCCRPRSAMVGLESKRHRCRTVFVLGWLWMPEHSAPMHLDSYLNFSEGQCTPLRNCAA